MVDTDTEWSTAHETVDPVKQLAQHLFHNPSDLIDSCRLMRRFQVSAADFQRALTQLEHRTAQLD